MFEKMMLAALASLGISLVAFPLLIPFLHKIKYGQSVSEYALESHKKKQGTPTMGGIVFILIPIITTLLFYPEALNSRAFLIVIISFVSYGVVGFIDDFIIIVQKNNLGLLPKYKLLCQLVIAMVVFYLFQDQAINYIQIPLLNIQLDLGIFYSIFVFLMFISTTNAVNITDGMDGLAGGTSIIALFPFVLFALIQGQNALAMLIFCVIASLIAYLKFNFFPAKIFMGDCGSLALGGLLAALSMVLKVELVLIVIGGVFVIETGSVALQILSVKIRKKRIFKYTPIHYSFALDGKKETDIVLMFWSIGLICAILGFFLGVI